MPTASVTPEIRPATVEDHPEIARLDGIAFGTVYSAADLEEAFGTEPPRFLLATIGSEIVGVTGDYRFEMTVPGGARLDVPGVTWVSVSPVHRRRGVLRALMNRQQADYAAAGEPAAILTASEGGIYQRFGFGRATELRGIAVDRRAAQLSRSVDIGAVRVLTPDAARAVLPDIHRRWRAVTPGAVSRSDALWDKHFADQESHRGGRSARFYLVHPDGYVVYRISRQNPDGRPANTCTIVDYAVVTDEAHAALWQVLLGLDLVGEIESRLLPADDPLPFLLTNARQYRTRAVLDDVWLRPIDLARTLGARRYAVEVDQVVEVRDGDVPAGRYRLTGGPDGAVCEPTDRPADVVTSRSALGSVYLGGHRVRALARAGAISGADAAIGRLDLAFGTDRAPRGGTDF